ncbi:MAG: DUF4301 family protein [Bacteroidetes bacterium]|nr:DUF4301 family protein [Bacteroidota bacterium]
MFTSTDLEWMQRRGVDPIVAEKQLQFIKSGFPFANLVAPATPGKGITTLKADETESLVKYFDKTFPGLHTVKFVPASGAASRMFKQLFEYLEACGNDPAKSGQLLEDKQNKAVAQIIEQFPSLACYQPLNETLQHNGISLDSLFKKTEFDTVIRFLLHPEGLNYASLPKALLHFHKYPDEIRTAMEEHLVEGVHYAKNNENEVHLHFTLSPEHITPFNELVSRVLPSYSARFNTAFQLSYSIQKPSTDTIAADSENNPFRDKDGHLVFRPGGHGALIENLHDIDADVIFIKNIDNVVPDRLKEETIRYKKALASYLWMIHKQIGIYFQKIDAGGLTDKDFGEMEFFVSSTLHLELPESYKSMDTDEKLRFLKNRFNRPIRVCGMVKNEGEPGGGPFWVKNMSGETSLQIVESSQVDMKNDSQKTIFQSSTHFNPVDLICCTRDQNGMRFNLNDYIDPLTGFISIKSKDGKELKALELPGLWNGAMAGWITLFVEVPIITFNPVKTINDLLRPEHLQG